VDSERAADETVPDKVMKKNQKKSTGKQGIGELV
jgi:hypothetical protein